MNVKNQMEFGIFVHNKKYVMKVLIRYINQLKQIKIT
jgi:hypothetical protein